MSERIRERTEELFPHEAAILDPTRRTEYTDRNVALIKEKKPTWNVRGINGLEPRLDQLIVYDYYFDGDHVGHVEGFEGVGYDAYAGQGVVEEGETLQYHDRLIHLNPEGPVETIREAQIKLEEYIQGTS